MQILIFIKENIKPLFYTSLLAGANIYLMKFLKQRNKLINRQNKVLHKEILSLEEAIQIMKSSIPNNSDKFYLIKTYPQINPIQIIAENPVYSNQVYFIEPSLNKIATQVIYKLNLMYLNRKDKDKKWEENLGNVYISKNSGKWIARENNKIGSANFNIEGYGEIVDHEIFDIKTNYQEIKDKGLYKKILENLAYFFYWIFLDPNRSRTKKLRPLSQNQDRTPFIKGPVIGSIQYLFSFIVGKPILLEAKIQNNKIIPITLSSSKEKLLSSLDLKIFQTNFKIGTCATISFIIYLFLRPPFSKLIKNFNKLIKILLDNNALLPKHYETFRMLQNSQIKDNLLCIICYTNCRNTVLLNCKHMIMCDVCRDVYKDNHCPLCKTEIVDDKKLVKE